MDRFAIFTAWLLFANVSALAGEPPKLDIDATCRRAIPLLGDRDNSPYQGCLRDEMDAWNELSKSWTTFKPSAQAVCAQETQMGGAPSYAELLTCLQLDKQAEEASRENQKPMSRPSDLPSDSAFWSALQPR